MKKRLLAVIAAAAMVMTSAVGVFAAGSQTTSIKAVQNETQADSKRDIQIGDTVRIKGVHLSPLGFAACQSKKFTNTTKSIFSHRIQNRTFLLGILPQISQIYTEIFAEKTPTDFTEHTELSC